MRIVCDSSTIIALEKINHLWLLENFSEEILIPPAVNKEIKSKKGINLPACFRVEEAKDKLYIEQNRKNLQIGEVEAITLAKDIKADLIILAHIIHKFFVHKVFYGFWGCLETVEDK